MAEPTRVRIRPTVDVEEFAILREAHEALSREVAEAFTSITEAINDIEDRLVGHDRLFAAIIGDIDTIAHALGIADDGEPEVEDLGLQDDAPMEGLATIAESSQALGGVPVPEETPEEEAARLRREAIEEAERANETSPEAAEPMDAIEAANQWEDDGGR